MRSEPSDAELLSAVELDPPSAPAASVLWLHGLGADGNDFVPIVEELGLPERSPVRFVFPHAPMRAVTLNGGLIMRAWYDIASLEIDEEVDEAGVRDSIQKVERLVGAEKSRGIPARSIVLAGFSQGGAIALETGLRHAERLGGILALSTYLPLAPTLEAEASPANRGVPIFMAHGTYDPVVPYFLGRRSREKLEALGYQVEWREYPMPHSVCAEEVEAIGAWLQRRIEK
ncbi:MAG: alpha/beta hydrolase [Planctomycetota bacterium]